MNGNGNGNGRFCSQSVYFVEKLPDDFSGGLLILAIANFVVLNVLLCNAYYYD